MNPKPVVTRFAPSPTGFMHVGSVRTAIFAWLFARKNHGTFILRIEDTDKERQVLGSIEHITDSLHWLGITWDEGIEVGGSHGPYIQSQRLDSYKKYAQTLIDKGYAYPDPYTQEEVEQWRMQAEAQQRPFLFRDHRPHDTRKWDGIQPLRFKIPEIKRYTWHDMVRGNLSAGEEALDDFVLIKGDGYPTYNFAHVIDDLEMKVTHIIRGEEFISSTPKFLSLYDALSIKPPILATVPVVLAPDGKKKLSKRDGAKDVLEYRKEGYLPEAIINFLSLLGWHPEGEQEVMSIAELTDAFELERVQKGGAIFDNIKLRWMNQQHLKRISDKEFIKQLTVLMNERGEQVPTYTQQILSLLRERSATLGEAANMLSSGEFNFYEAVSVDAALLMQNVQADRETVKRHLEKVRILIEPTSGENFSAERIKELIFPYANEQGRGAVLWPLRVALSGKEKSPDPFTLAELLGKDQTLQRIKSALQVL